MSTSELHTLAGPYVLDALPADERIGFEEHLAYCSACTAEVTQLREAAIKLAANVAVSPPPSLKANVLASIAQVPQSAPAEPLPPSAAAEPEHVSGEGVVLTPRRGFGRLRRGSTLALAAAAVVVAISGGIAIDQYRDNTATTATNNQIAAVLAEPDARTVHGEVKGGGQATVVTSNQRDAAVVVLHDLRTLPASQTYQLWLIDSAQTAHSIGLADATSLTKVVTGGVTGKIAFGLTVEPAGGSAKPTMATATLISMT
jgi:anti-sigma-K factor RskA